MSYQLVIAEKPSVARSIAGVIGADKKQDGYMEGNGYLVSWCIGHLVSLADAGTYDERFKKWRYDDLPILPQEWQYIIPDDKKKQFDTLRSLMERPDVTGLVCATDAGREGELIFRFVYQMAGCKKPFQRLWISSMEDAAIKDGFAHLKPGADYCASLMWKYQDMEADEITRKRRQAEFWVWYIKEAARLCDDPIKERIKVESFIPDTPILEIKNAQDFVRAINSELDYIKHEKMNDKIILRIYTRKHKKGLTYPACGRHSEHIKISSEAVSKLGKFKEWAVELRTEIHLYYCDNQDCPEKSFPDRTEVGLNEEKPTFYISQIKRRMRKSSMTFLACHS